MCRTNAPNVLHHIQPLLLSKQVDKIFLVRNEPIPLTHAKLQQITYHVDLSTTKPFYTIRFIWHLLHYLLKGFLLLWRHPIDHIISINPLPYGALSALLARLFGKSITWMVIGDDLDHFRKKHSKKLMRLSGHQAWITLPGEIQQQVVIKAGWPEHRIKVMPHTIDQTLYHPIKNRDKKPYTILFVGGLTTLKGADQLVEALLILKKRDLHLKAVLVGDGPLMDPLKKRILKHQAEDHIKLPGAVYGQDLIQYYQKSQFFVLPSHREGFPFVLVEALCCGVLPIITPVGAIPETIQQGYNGWLLSPLPKAPEIAKAIDHLLTHPQDCHQLAQGVMETSAQFNHQHAIKAWQSILDQENQHL
ncbi:glycosyltransferase family 4 protein [Magnetococcales bacterium HHB-1]